MRNKQEFYKLFLIIAIFFLIFYKLGHPFLWYDESEVALFGKRILTFGIPKVWDGRNLLSQFSHPIQEGVYDFNSNLIHTHQPWLQFYITALSLGIFGNNTLASRLPFALIGLLAFIYFLYFCKKYVKLGPLYYLPGVLLLFSIPFILFARQCRYYAPNIFLTLLFVDSFISLTREKKYSPFYFALAGTVFVFNNAVPFAPTSLALGIYILLDFKKRFKFKPMIKGAALLLIGFIFYLAFQMYLATDFPIIFQFNFHQFIHGFLYYINSINAWCFPFIILLVLFILIIINRNKTYGHEVSNMFKDDFIQLIGIIAITNLIFFPNMILLHFRYITHTLPFFLILLSYTLFLIYKKNKIIYVLLLFCFLFTDIFGRCITRLPFFMLATMAKKSDTVSGLLKSDRFIGQVARYGRASMEKSQDGKMLNKDIILHAFIDKYKKINIHYPFFILLKKIANPYPDVNTSISKYLVENSKKDDVVVVNYSEEPIIFYTDLITRGGVRGIGLDRRDSEFGREMMDYLYRQFGIREVKNPDWVIIRNGWCFEDKLTKIITSGNYEKIELDSPDTPWGNNPDPHYYIYHDSSKDPNVIIYKKLD